MRISPTFACRATPCGEVSSSANRFWMEAVSALLAFTFCFSGSASVMSLIIASIAERLPLTATFWRQRKASEVRSACSVVSSVASDLTSTRRHRLNRVDITVNATTTAKAKVRRCPIRMLLKKFIVVSPQVVADFRHARQEFCLHRPGANRRTDAREACISASSAVARQA